MEHELESFDLEHEQGLSPYSIKMITNIIEFGGSTEEISHFELHQICHFLKLDDSCSNTRRNVEKVGPLEMISARSGDLNCNAGKHAGNQNGGRLQNHTRFGKHFIHAQCTRVR